MAWDTLQPTNTTKIRNLGVVIRPNWAAIQTADSTFTPDALNFKNRTPSVVPIDPAAIATAYIAYCKEDAAGNPELFGISAASEIVQFTKAGRLGVATQGVNALNFIMDSTSFTYGKNQMIVASGSFSAAGALLSGVNMSAVSHPGTGSYNIAVNADVLLNSNYQVIVTCFNNGAFGDSERVANLVTKGVPSAGNPTNIAIKIRSGGGSSNDQKFDVIVIGGR
jgi:hypothetical protein